MAWVGTGTRRLASGVSPLWAWLETVFICAVFVLVGWWIDPADPFFLDAPFPWLLLAPLLPALRYGFSHGFVAALLLVGLMALAREWNGGEGQPFPAQFSIGMIILAMLSGEFSDMWTRRYLQQQVINDYQRMRLDEFTRNYHLLKVSHDRLEHRLAASGNSLRGALLDLRRMLQERAPGRDALAEVASHICGLFAGFGWIQVAGLYEVRGEHIVVRPLAALGDPGAVDPFDPMVRRALAERRVISLREELMASEQALEEDLLAVVPLVDVNRHVWALLVIREMPFVALHLDNLRLLAVLGGHIGDILSTTLGTLREPVPDPEQAAFVRDLRRAMADLRDYGLPALVVALVFPKDHPEAEAMLNLFLGQTRGLDRAWRPDPQGADKVLFLLMPLTSEHEFEAYERRMNTQLEQRFGQGIEELGIRIHLRALGRRDRVEDILDWLHETAGIDRHSDPDPGRTGA